MFEDYCSFPNLGYVSFWCRVLAVETEKWNKDRWISKAKPACKAKSLPPHIIDPSIHRISIETDHFKSASLSQVAWSAAFSACPISPAHLWVRSWRSWLLTERHICFFSYQLSPHFAHYVVSKQISTWVPHMIDSQVSMRPRHNTTPPPLMKGPLCIWWLPSSA